MLHHKFDKVRRYRWAFIITSIMWVLQLLTFVFFAQSLTLFGDMAHSFADILLLLGTFFIFLNEIERPDDDHRNKKVLLVRIAAFLLWINAIYIISEAVMRLRHPVNFSGWPVLYLALISAVGNFCAHRMIHGVDKSEHDHAHEANVAHLLTDLALSLAVLVSALGTILFQLPAIDALLALLVGCWMTNWGYKLFKSTLSSAHDAHEDDHHFH